MSQEGFKIFGSRAHGRRRVSASGRSGNRLPREKEEETAALFGEFDAAGFADDGDADLAGVLKFFFDFAREVSGQGKGLFVIDLFGLDEDTEFAASLDGKAFFHAGIGAANFFEVFDTLDVGGHGFGARAGT